MPLRATLGVFSMSYGVDRGTFTLAAPDPGLPA